MLNTTGVLEIDLLSFKLIDQGFTEDLCGLDKLV